MSHQERVHNTGRIPDQAYIIDHPSLHAFPRTGQGKEGKTDRFRAFKNSANFMPSLAWADGPARGQVQLPSAGIVLITLSAALQEPLYDIVRRPSLMQKAKAAA